MSRLSRFHGLLGLIALAAVVFAAIPAANAAEILWNSGAGSWSESAKWNPQNVPNIAGEAARLPAGNYTVSLDVSPTIDSLNLVAGLDILNLNAQMLTFVGATGLRNAGTVVANSGTATIAGPVRNASTGLIKTNNDQTLVFTGSTVVNDGNIQNGDNGTSQVMRFDANTTLSGSGTLRLTSTGSYAAGLNTGAGFTLTNAAGHLIAGRGGIDAAMVNQGEIRSDNTAGWQLFLRTNDKTNTGTIKAGAGNSFLTISGITINNAGGQIVSDDGNVFIQDDARIVGGTLSRTNGTTRLIQTTNTTTDADAILENVTIAAGAEYRVMNDAGVTLAGTTLTNNGVFQVGEAGATQFANVASNLTLGGTGTLIMTSNGSYAAKLSTSPGMVLTNAAGHLISGRGGIEAALVNQGEVRSDVGGTWQLILRTNDKTNMGILKAGAGDSYLVISGITINNAGGQIVSDDGSVFVQDGARIVGGTLSRSSGTRLIETGNTPPTVDATLENVTIASGAEYRVRNDAGLVLTGSSLTNNGTLQVGDFGSNQFVRAASSLTLAGPGTLRLTSTSSYNGRFESDTAVVVTNAAGHLIAGRGGIDASLVNQGEIRADNGGNWQLILRTKDKINQGTIKAGAGDSYLNISGISLHNETGQIVSDGGTVLIQDGARVVGGTLARTSGALLFETQNTAPSVDATLENVTIAAGTEYRVRNDAGLVLTGPALTNNGTLQVGDYGSTQFVRAASNLTLAGPGTLRLTSTASYVGRLESDSGMVVTNAAGHLIAGRGGIDAALVNQGEVRADNTIGWQLVLRTMDKTNTGTLKAGTGNSILNISGITVNNAGGQIVSDGGTVLIQDGGRVVGGTLIRTNGTQFVETPNNAAAIDATLENVTLASGTDYLTRNDSDVRLKGMTFTNDGYFQVGDFGANQVLRVDDNLTIQGEGSIRVTSNGSYNGRVEVAPGKLLVNAAGHTIHGRGAIVATGANILNRGTIAALDAGTWQFHLNANVFTNEGVVRAGAGGAWMYVDTTPTNFAAGTLSGGTWESITSDLRLAGVNVVTNQATVLMDGSNANIFNASSGSTSALAGFVTNGANGSFTIRNGRNFATSGAFANSGDVVVGSGSTFTVGAAGAYTQTTALASTRIDGALTLTGGSIVDVQDGTLFGRGTINAPVRNDAQVLPGTSAGKLSVNGAYTQTAAGILTIELGAHAPAIASWDTLAVTGAATLNGSLDVQGISGFQPAVGDTFKIITCGSRTGTFSSATYEGAPSTGLFSVVYGPTSVSIVIESIFFTAVDLPDPADDDLPGDDSDPDLGDDSGPDLGGVPAVPAAPAVLDFHGRTASGGTVAFDLALPREAYVRVSVYDVTGREVAILRDAYEPAGLHAYELTTRAARGAVSSGVYFGRVEVTDATGVVAKTARAALVR